jgi:membrane-bound metal-dependent hydrolase YbcI (DUF457 family)
MFAGHIGAALVLGRAEPRINVGIFVAAALLLDFVLWLCVLLGWESVVIPADFPNRHQAEFIFPFSHGLLAGAVWSAAAGMAGLASSRSFAIRWRAAVLLALAVFSHWILDVVVHRPELPLAGPASRAVGFGLWDNMPMALILEAAIVAIGVFLFASRSRLPRSRTLSLIALALAVLAFTLQG